jgi:hypothetical protein
MDLSCCSNPFLLAPAGRLMQGIVRACVRIYTFVQSSCFLFGDLAFVVFQLRRGVEWFS